MITPLSTPIVEPGLHLASASLGDFGGVGTGDLIEGLAREEIGADLLPGQLGVGRHEVEDLRRLVLELRDRGEVRGWAACDVVVDAERARRSGRRRGGAGGVVHGHDGAQSDDGGTEPGDEQVFRAEQRVHGVGPPGLSDCLLTA